MSDCAKIFLNSLLRELQVQNALSLHKSPCVPTIYNRDNQPLITYKEETQPFKSSNPNCVGLYGYLKRSNFQRQI